MKAVIGFGNTNREIKMKNKSLFVAFLLMAGVLVAPSANAANEKPLVESFTFTPNDVDISGSNLTVNFEVIVSHPYGIDNSSVLLSLTNSNQFKISSYLFRTDRPVVTTQKRVVFKGSVILPRELQPGAYIPTLSTIRNNISAGYQYETGVIESNNIRNLTGAENALLIRNGKDLSLDYTTFIGPTYDTRINYDFKNVVKYNNSVTPILKVGESYNPTDYFEIKVPELKFETKSKTPKVCTAADGKLNFIAEGACNFIVLTPKSNDYLEKNYEGVVVVTAARVKPILQVPAVQTQTTKDLPKIIELGQVYSAAQGWVLPVSITPSVCFATAHFVRIVSGGTCTLNYQTIATPEFVASDVYPVTFDISVDGKPIVKPTPLVTPTPVATPTAKPVVKRTISCVKGTKTIKKTGTSPKCPAGYKLKK
jgi:hypothetical protein